MDQWEYNRLVLFRESPEDQIRKMNEFGKDGWELASTVVWGDREGFIHFFKRRVVDTRTYRG
jgi:hypothetical protein